MHGMKRHGGQHGRGHGRMAGHGDGHGLFGGRSHHGGGMGGGGRRGKRFTGEEMRLMVLGLLGQEPQHGYQLIRSFAAKSGDAYTPSPGMLYPLLTMLADMGLAEELAGEGSGRRSFGLTEAGQAEVDAHRGVLDAALHKLAAMAQSASRIDAGPVKRAMMNLRTATIQRLGREGASDQSALDVAAILDEAAQKIERL